MKKKNLAFEEQQSEYKEKIQTLLRIETDLAQEFSANLKTQIQAAESKIRTEYEQKSDLMAEKQTALIQQLSGLQKSFQQLETLNCEKLEAAESQFEKKKATLEARNSQLKTKVNSLAKMAVDLGEKYADLE